jgi:rhamnosyltransferase
MDHVKISAPIFKDYKSQNLIPSIRVSSLGLLTKSNSYSIKFDRFLVISSGMAIKNEVFKVVGFMNEKYFIDYVDTDFCFRCFASNYNIYINCNAIMNHSVGDKMYNFAGLYFFIHKPLRLYYQTRNCIYFLKNKYIPLMYKVREIISFFFHQFVLLLFFYQNKPQYFKAIILGIFHAIKGLQGRINESRNMKS